MENMKLDNMDKWFAKMGYEKISESPDATDYERYTPETNRREIVTIVNNASYRDNCPAYFKYSVNRVAIDNEGNILWPAIDNVMLEHLQLKAKLLMKKYMQDAIRAELPHIPSHSPIGGN